MNSITIIIIILIVIIKSNNEGWIRISIFSRKIRKQTGIYQKRFKNYLRNERSLQIEALFGKLGIKIFPEQIWHFFEWMYDVLLIMLLILWYMYCYWYYSYFFTKNATIFIIITVLFVTFASITVISKCDILTVMKTWWCYL